MPAGPKKRALPKAKAEQFKTPLKTPLKLSKLAKSVASPRASPRSDAATAAGEPQITAAQEKRINRAKLALRKLYDNLGPLQVKDACLPALGYPKLSFTAISGPGTCNIGVVLYTESFYVYRNAKIPEGIAKATGLQAQVCHYNYNSKCSVA